MPSKSATQISKFEFDDSDNEEEEVQQTQEEPDLIALKTHVKSEKNDKDDAIKKACWTNYTLWATKRRAELRKKGDMTNEEKNIKLKAEWAALPADEKDKLKAKVKEFKDYAQANYPEEMKKIEEAKKKRPRRDKQASTEDEEEGEETETDNVHEKKRAKTKGGKSKNPLSVRPAISRDPRTPVKFGQFFVWKSMFSDVPQADQPKAFEKCRADNGDAWRAVLKKVSDGKEECDRIMAIKRKEDFAYRERVLVTA